MLTEFSPAYIEILLHIGCRVGPIECRDAPVVVLALNDFLEAELIKVNNTNQSGYEITTRGRCLINMWGQTPLPQMIWVDPRDNTPL